VVGGRWAVGKWGRDLLAMHYAMLIETCRFAS